MPSDRNLSEYMSGTQRKYPLTYLFSVLFIAANEEIPYILNDFTLGKSAATKACKALGWSVKWTSDKSLICTAPGRRAGHDCDKCDTWRLLVWTDGGTDISSAGQTYHTKAGRWYGGHQPCKGGWNLPLCDGAWDKS